ncbi:MAG: molybdenum cofactor guanylyltransferase [Chloroflexi bacterium]|nr:MAG: molybdenum cofactor guanylyltransferase [Chloroflexota bacterium]
MAAETSVSVAILAGGRSRRMGRDKTALLLRGKPLLQHVVDSAASLQLPIQIITNTPDNHAYLGLPMHTDVFPGSGSIGGLYTALHYTTSDYVLCLACDSPYLQPALLRYLIALRHDYDAVVPYVRARRHPLVAVYSKRCLPVIHERIERGELRITTMLNELHTRFVEENDVRRYDPGLKSFFNANTPEEFARIAALSR